MRVLARADLRAEDGLLRAMEISVSVLREENGALMAFLGASRESAGTGPRFIFLSCALPDLLGDPENLAFLVARACDAEMAQNSEILMLDVNGMVLRHAKPDVAVAVSVLARQAGSTLDIHRRLTEIHMLGPEAFRFIGLSLAALNALSENTERRFQALLALGPFAPPLLHSPDLLAVVDAGLPLIPALAERVGSTPATVRKLIRVSPRVPRRGVFITPHDWCRMSRILSPGQDIESEEGLATLRSGFAILDQRAPMDAVEREMREAPVRSWGRVARECAQAKDADTEDYLYAASSALIEKVWGPVMIRRHAPRTWSCAAAGDLAAAEALRGATTGIPRGNALEHRVLRLLQRSARLRELTALSREWHAAVLTDPGLSARDEASWSPLLGTARDGDYAFREICSLGELERHGHEQRHCVATHAAAIVNAQAHQADLVFSVDAGGATAATAMFSLREGRWSVREIKGRRNARAPETAVAAATALLPRLNAAWESGRDAYMSGTGPIAALMRKYKAKDFRLLPEDPEALSLILPASLRVLSPETLTDLINSAVPANHEFIRHPDQRAEQDRADMVAALVAAETETGLHEQGGSREGRRPE